jgi:hypothetical protein
MKDALSAIGLAALVTYLIVSLIVAFGTCPGRQGMALFMHKAVPSCEQEKP